LKAVRLLLAVATTAALSGCASSTTNSSSTFRPNPSGDPIPAPANLVTKGTLTVASELDYRPQEYKAGGAAAGFDIDLARALAAEMRLKLAVVDYRASDIVPDFAQQNRRYDMGISAMPETPELKNSANVIEYFQAGLAILTPAPDRNNVRGLDSLCGLRVGAERDTTAAHAILRDDAVKCSHKPIDQRSSYTSDVDAAKDLVARNLDAMLDDYPVAAYLSQIYHLRLVAHQFQTTPDVMVFPLADDSVYRAIKAAFDRVRAEGTYAHLLGRWGLKEGAVS
jgi:polar amino acid transport system substrate-binding protein